MIRILQKDKFFMTHNKGKVTWVLLATIWKKKNGRKDFCLGQTVFEEAGILEDGIILDP